MDDKRIDYELAQAEDFERRSQALHQSTGRRASNDFDVLAHLCRRKAAILQDLDRMNQVLSSPKVRERAIPSKSPGSAK